jgi:uncharacterized protein (DUF885 family)
MRLVGRILGGLLLLVVLALAGASVWFWFYPVTVTNYVNKFTAEFAFETPELLTGLGVIDNTPLDFHSGKLADYTKAHEEKQLARLRKNREGLNRFNPEKLKGQEKLSWEIATWFLDDIIAQAEFEHSGYRVNQISGPMVDLPQFLTDTHVIKNEKSVKRYISRLNEFGRVIGEVKARVEEDRAAGVTPPDFVIEKSLVGMRAFIEGGAEKNPLVTTLPAKLDKIEGLSAEKKAALMAEATKAVTEKVIPGYEAMIALFEDMGRTATHDAGIWRIPDGDRIYAAALRNNTTTDMTADEIHEIGLAEVERIEREMTAILDAQGIPAVDEAGAAIPFAKRIALVSQRPGEIFPNDDDGRKAMIDYLTQLNVDVMKLAPKYFITIPRSRSRSCAFRNIRRIQRPAAITIRPRSTARARAASTSTSRTPPTIRAGPCRRSSITRPRPGITSSFPPRSSSRVCRSSGRFLRSRPIPRAGRSMRKRSQRRT